jgi:hypothetical protein
LPKKSFSNKPTTNNNPSPLLPKMSKSQYDQRPNKKSPAQDIMEPLESLTLPSMNPMTFDDEESMDEFERFSEMHARLEPYDWKKNISCHVCDTVFHCPPCNRIFSFEEAVKTFYYTRGRHFNIVYEEHTIRCPDCVRSFYGTFILRRDMLWELKRKSE